MGFELVPYETLVRKIHVAIDTIIENDGLDSTKRLESIKKLDNKERSKQAQFLLQMIELLSKNKISDEDKPRLLNAAACFVRDQIKKTYKFNNVFSHPDKSDLFRCLTNALAVKDSKDFTLADRTTLYSGLRKFICVQVYHEGDPSKGYLDNHPFSNIDGYQVVADLKAMSLDICKFTIEAVEEREKNSEITPPVTLSAPMQPLTHVSTYSTLVGKINKNIDDLIKREGLDPTQRIQSLQNLRKKDRRLQAHFLHQIIEQLSREEMPEAEKSRLLKGAACFVRDQIAKSYAASYVNKNPAGSELYVALTTSLDLDNMPEFSSSERAVFYNALRKFLFAKVYSKGDPIWGYQYDHPFTGSKIKDYKVEEDLKTICRDLARFSIEVLDQAEEKFKLENKAPPLVRSTFEGNTGAVPSLHRL